MLWRMTPHLQHRDRADLAQICTVSPAERVEIGPIADQPQDVKPPSLGLFEVADQCIVQTDLERAKPWLVVPPPEEPVAEYWLADLL